MDTHRYRAFVLMCVALAGCGSGTRSDRLLPRDSAEGLTVVTEDGARLTGGPVRIDVRYVDPSAPDVEISGEAAGPSSPGWSILARFDGSILSTGSASAAVTDAQLMPGFASVQRSHEGEHDAIATAGTLEFSIDGDRIAGEVSGSDKRFDATFAGKVALSCAVPSELIPVPKDGAAVSAPVAVDAAPVLVVDKAFASAACKSLGASPIFAPQEH